MSTSRPETGPPPTTMTFALARPQPRQLDLETFAWAAGLHPDLVRRLVALGLLEAERGPAGDLRLAPTQLAVSARLKRLKSGLGLNYAALGVVVALLDRIDDLETELRNRPAEPGGSSWT
jgi:chaperone modulatory protein CbpM